MFEVMLAQVEGTVENAGGGLDPKLALYSVIIAYVLQAMRNIKWVEDNRAGLPFVALGLGVGIAALKLNGVMGWADIILSGCMLGLTASGFQAAATKLPLGMESVRKASNGAAVIGLCFLLATAGCSGGLIDKAPTEDQALRAAVDTYAASLETLTDFYAAGKIDDEMARKIEEHRKIAWLALEEWRDRVRAGRPAGESVRRFTVNFAAMIAAEKRIISEDR